MKTNEELQKDVMAEIRWDPLLMNAYTQIGVSAKDGVVTLSGLVDTYLKKIAAERAAQRVHGVSVVACDIEVKLGATGVKSDTELAEMVNNSLRWSTALKDDKIEIKIDNGWVYLDGEVDWVYQKKSAQSNIEGLIGIKGITNRIKVKSTTINTEGIHAKISEAFHRSATIDSDAIKIHTAGNKVTLEGTVRSWVEKEEAERIAWSSLGVLTVDNKIKIDTSILSKKQLA